VLFRFLSLALDRLPCIPDEFCTVAFPKMRLAPGIDDFNAPDVFSERLLQARLTKNWYTVIQLGNTRTSVYDPGAAEEQYESLRRDFVFSLPDVFALIEPNKDWDSQLPMLVRQRQMLRISIFALLCQLFRPLLQLSASQMEDMLQYKQDLVLTHRDHLLRAAISLLDSISCLHELMGDNQNRFFLLSFYTFEPAMLLGMHLLSFDSNKKTSRQARAPNECKDFWKSTSVANDANMAHIDVTSHYQCRVHIDKALKRLNMLREVSAIADLGARKLDQVTAKLNMQSPSLPNDQENSISFKGREPVRSPGQVPRNQQTERMGSWMDLDTTQHDPSATASLKKIAPVTPWIGDLSEDSLESLVFAAPWPTHQPDDWNAYWSPINNASVNARSDSSRASFASNATLGLGSEGSSAGSSQYSMFHNPPIESLEPLGTSSNSEPETSSRLLPLNIAMQKHQDHPDPPQSGGTDAGNRWDTFFSNLPNGLLENSM
jgi:hypothetical protein